MKSVIKIGEKPSEDMIMDFDCTECGEHIDINLRVGRVVPHFVYCSRCGVKFALGNGILHREGKYSLDDLLGGADEMG